MKSDEPPSAESLLLEAALEGAERAIDIAFDNELLAAIPIIGTAYKVCRGIDDLRARAFRAKLLRFVTDPSLTTDAARERLARVAATPSRESRKIGETLFLVLEQLTDMDKPPLLAKVFAGYLADRITEQELRRLASAIDTAFVEDLNQLISTSDPNQQDPAPWKQSLVVAGLTAVGVPGPIGGRLVYFVTPLGQALRKALAAPV